MLSKDDGRVDWNLPAATVHNLVRGMTPWPGAHSMLNGKRFKVLTTRIGVGVADAPAGTIVALDTEAFLVACGAGLLRVLRGQVAGRKALDAPQLAAGRAIVVGQRFDG